MSSEKQPSHSSPNTKHGKKEAQQVTNFDLKARRAISHLEDETGKWVESESDEEESAAPRKDAADDIDDDDDLYTFTGRLIRKAPNSVLARELAKMELPPPYVLEDDPLKHLMVRTVTSDARVVSSGDGALDTALRWTPYEPKRDPQRTRLRSENALRRARQAIEAREGQRRFVEDKATGFMLPVDSYVDPPPEAFSVPIQVQETPPEASAGPLRRHKSDEIEVVRDIYGNKINITQTRWNATEAEVDGRERAHKRSIDLISAMKKKRLLQAIGMIDDAL